MSNDNDKLYEEAMGKLLETCKKQGITVEFVGLEMLYDYIGMNSEAAKKMGFKMPPNTIYVDKSLHGIHKYETLRHEMKEMGLMREGMEYFPAHKLALPFEKIKPRKVLKHKKRKLAKRALISLASMR